MFLSIIIPVHNGERTIQRTLDSIRDQNFDDIEVIVVDDHSTDSSKSIIENYNDLQITLLDSDYEVHCAGNTRQYGLDRAHGEWITFIDHDDIFMPNAFNNVKKLIEDNNLTHICCTLLSQEHEITHQEVKLEPNQNENIDSWLHGKFFNRENIFLRHPEIKFEKDLFFLEDVCFINKILAMLYSEKILNNITFDYFHIYTYKWYFGITNTHAVLHKGKYTHNEWGLANHYCGIVFPKYEQVIPMARSEDQFITSVKMMMSSVCYAFSAKQYFIEKFGIDDEIVKILQNNINNQTWILWKTGIKDSQILQYLEFSIDNRINPEWATKYIYDDPIIWLGELKKYYIDKNKELGLITSVLDKQKNKDNV